MEPPKPLSERKTESLLRDLFHRHGYFDTDGIRVEEQKSDDPEITKLLKGASKTGGKGKGAPEFIVTATAHPDLILVAECKADTRHHASPKLNLAADYAVDGALHYGRILAKRFNVIAIGASAQTKKEFKLDAYLIARRTTDARLLRTQFDQPVGALDALDVPQQYASRDPTWKSGA